MDYAALFEHLHPDFFDQDYLKSLPEDLIYRECILNLKDWKEKNEENLPKGTTFGYFKGSLEEIRKAAGRVVADWPEFFNEGDRFYCGFLDGRMASFCMIEDMGTFQTEKGIVKIGGPGCVGTLPEYRRRGIGLQMVANVTQILKEEGYDLSYIHYTGVADWYGKLGYHTVLSWNGKGILS